MNSNLAGEHRLLALDMRGHGLSDKPREGYSESRLWADDLNAIIQGLNLDHPILCGWSYGPLIILDYIRYYGEDAIGGINFVDGITKLGSDAALSVIAQADRVARAASRSSSESPKLPAKNCGRLTTETSASGILPTPASQAV